MKEIRCSPCLPKRRAPPLSARPWENIFAKCCKSKVASWKMDGRELMRMEKGGNERGFIGDLGKGFLMQASALNWMLK